MTQYDLDLRDYWRVVKKRRSVILFSMISMFIFSFLFARYQKSKVIDTFSSSATVRIDRLINFREYSYVPYQYSNTDEIATEVKTITSFAVMAETARRIGVIPDSLSDMSIKSNPELIAQVNNLAAMVQPERYDYTNIITIATFAYDPLRARDLAQLTAEAYRDNRRIELSRQIDNSINFIRDQVETIEDSIRIVREEFRKVSEKHQIISPYAGSDDIGSQIQQLNQRRNEATARLSAIQISMDVLGKEGIVENALLVSAFAEGEGTLFRERYNELLSLYEQRTDFLRYLTAEHPNVKGVNEKITTTIHLLQSQLEGNLRILKMQQGEVEKNLAELRGKFSEAGEQKQVLEHLDIRMRDLGAMYTEYVRQMQALQIKKSEKIDEITITKPAVVNRTPVNTSHSVYAVAVIGIFLGLVIGLIFAFVFEAFDTSIGTIEDVEGYLGVPVIGLIPQIGMQELKDDIAFSRKDNPENKDKILDEHARLVIHYAPRSPLAESYRSLRTNIQFLSFEREAKVLLFSSSSPREGKTTTIVNLALTMAQSGNRVLLVDADMRKPKVDRIFGLDRDRGLSEIILGNHDWRSCIKTVTDIITGEHGLTDIILTPGIDNLHIITCGAIPPNPSELLNSDSMDRFMSETRAEYDMVLFDCSPVLPATDTAVLGRKVDGVVFVYAFGRVPRGSLKRAKAQLETVKVRVIGVVLNGIRNEASVDFQDYKYKKYYYTTEAVDEAGPLQKLKKAVEGMFTRVV
ncbi:MAG: polysaccharide biosynthesis tyrosine autokinase [Candidatus Latescibacterota bacterium]